MEIICYYSHLVPCGCVCVCPQFLCLFWSVCTCVLSKNKNCTCVCLFTDHWLRERSGNALMVQAREIILSRMFKKDQTIPLGGMSVNQQLNRGPLLPAEDFWWCLWKLLEQKLKELRAQYGALAADSGTLFQALPQRIESHPLTFWWGGGRGESGWGGEKKEKCFSLQKYVTKYESLQPCFRSFQPSQKKSKSKWDKTDRELLCHLFFSWGAVFQ